MKFFIGLLLMAGLSVSAFAGWESLHGPHGGHITCMEIANDGTIYAGTADAGVFASSDGGINWEATNFALLGVNGVAESSDGTIFVQSGTELFKSTDGLTTFEWIERVDNFEWRSVFATSNGTLLAPAFSITRTKVYRSTDNGATWTEAWSQNSTIFLSLFEASNGDILYCAQNAGGFRSTDDGETWTFATENLEDGNFVRYMAQAANGNLIAGDTDGVHTSTDGGATWTQTGNVTGIPNNMAVAGDGTILLSSNSGTLLRSTDNGENWESIFQNDGAEGAIRAYTMLTNNGTFIIGSDTRGIYTSTDNGDSFVNSSHGLHGVHVISVSQNTDGDVFAVTGDRDRLGIPRNGQLHRFNSADNSWEELTSPVGVSAVACIDGAVYLSSDSHSHIYRSADNGDTWTEMTGPNFGSLFYFFGVSPTTGNLFAGGEVGLYRSEDGDNWTRVNERQCVSFDFAADGGLYSNENLQINYSDDDGDNWTTVSDQYGRDLAVNKSTGTLYMAANDQFKRSADGGDTWQNILGDIFPGGILNESGTVLATSDGSIFTTIAAGPWGVPLPWKIFRSDDDGTTWAEDFTGLRIPQVLSMSEGSEDVLIAAHDGVYVYSDAVSVEDVAVDIPFEYTLAQNIPNPFNPETSIHFTLPQTGEISLLVFDIMGREVEELVTGNLSAGSHQVQFDGSNLSSGIYFYSLRADGFTSTRKMTLIK
ncbi:T9SS type A sorting domain-containing protein [bacterium]|nr:T9SS type A sorting domain-containing protein [bacterium]